MDISPFSSKRRTFKRLSIQVMFKIKSKLTPRENISMCFALGFFLLGCLIVVALQFTIGLYFTKHYFVAHFLLGLFLPFCFYSMGGLNISFKIGWFLTAFFHFGYELWEDLLTRPLGSSPDWDQVLTGSLGLIAALFVYRRWNLYLDSKPSTSLLKMVDSKN